MFSIKEHIKDYICDGTPEAVVDRYASLPERAQGSDYGEYDRNVVVLDTETTGFSLSHDELTQIAAAKLERGKIIDWFVTFVDPGRPIPDDVAHLTNIHDEDVSGAPTPMEALASLVEFVGDAKVVAHNAEFDRNFTTKHPAGYPLLENEWIDSLDLARISLPRMKSHRLIDLVKAFGAPLSTHRADEDVAATCALYRILLAGIDSMPASLVREISRMADGNDWPTVSVFKYFAKRGLDSSLANKDDSVAAMDVSRETSITGRLGPLEADEVTLHDMSKADMRQNCLSSNVFGNGSAQERFSMRGLRTRRLAGCEWKPKKDAWDFSCSTASQAYDSVPTEGRDPKVPMQDPDVFHVKHSEMKIPSAQTIREAFQYSGLVGSLFDSYEIREEQVEMSLAVRDAFEKSENLSVEAGTGVGKSMAYLTPLAYLAVENDVNVGVATKTNALLDQLIYKDLPKLSDSMKRQGFSLTYAALKGFSHYPCLRKIERIIEDGPRNRVVGTKECSQAPALAALVSFIEQTEYDDMDSLKIDYRTLPRKAVTTTSHECMRRKCPFFGVQCFVHGSRRKAEASHVVVTNHSLLFCDLAADNRLLPPVRYWAVDEAHNAEGEVRRAFSLSLSADELKLLSQKVSAQEASRNVFEKAERVVSPSGDGMAGTLLFALTSKAKAAGKEYADAAMDFCAHLRDLLSFDPGKRSKNYETVEIWVNDAVRSSDPFRGLDAYGRGMTDRAEKLISCCQDLVAYLEDANDSASAAVQREIASVAMDLKDVVKAAEVIMGASDERYVYSATLNKRADKPGNKIEAMPLSVGNILNETLYEKTSSVVYTSATLAVGDAFKSFEGAMGLNESDNSISRSLALASSYDFDRNMVVFVAKDMPEPNDPQYLAKLQDLLVKVHVAQRGSMLTLFTNRKEMERCFDEVNPVLKENDLRLVCQKWGVSMKGLRDDFLADEHLSLFALKSFWEGFDAPGATLRGVVIPKLPFAKPTDPLSCERSARDDQAWRKFVLPAAILETKQAAGRLIRRSDDKGALILADKRLLTKGYGRSFLNAMPSRNVRVLSVDEIAEEIERGW